MRRIVFVMLVVLLSAAFAKVWYVHPDSTRDSIQPCLDACGAGDTVLVAAGTYHERILLSPYACLYGGLAGTELSRNNRDWNTNVTWALPTRVA